MHGAVANLIYCSQRQRALKDGQTVISARGVSVEVRNLSKPGEFAHA
jgi:hypothetical protein